MHARQSDVLVQFLTFLMRPHSIILLVVGLYI